MSDKDFIQMLVRKALTLGAGALMSHGILAQNSVTGEMIETLTSALMILISVWWSRKHQNALKSNGHVECSPLHRSDRD